MSFGGNDHRAGRPGEQAAMSDPRPLLGHISCICSGSRIRFVVGGETQTPSCPPIPRYSTTLTQSTRLNLCSPDSCLTLDPLLAMETCPKPACFLLIPHPWGHVGEPPVILSHRLRNFCSSFLPTRANLLEQLQFSRSRSNFPLALAFWPPLVPKYWSRD